MFLPLELTDPRHLIPPVAPPVYNRSIGLPFTADDNNTALLRIDRRNQNLITLKFVINPMTVRADGTPITLEQNQSWFNNGNIPVVLSFKTYLSK